MTVPFSDVSATTPEPSHDFILTDGSGNKVYGLLKRPGRTDPATSKIVYDDEPEGLVRNTFPNQAIRFTQQGGNYADYQPPWQPFEQDTWEGGRGLRYFHKDKTRYADSYRTFTHIPNQITLAGAPRFSGGNFQGDAPLEHLYILPGNFTGHSHRRTALYDSDRYVGRKFSPTNTAVVNRILTIVGQTGTAPGNFRVDIYSDNSGTPNTSLANGTLTVAAFGAEEISKTVAIDLNTSITLTAGTNYWFIVSSVTNGSATNHWWVLTDDTSTGLSIRSSNGSSWGENSPFSAPYMAVADYHSSTSDEVKFKYFEYKRGWYAIKAPEDASPAAVYRNGWRGAADSNSGALTKLKDATQTTWQNFFIVGGIVLITKGPGSRETKPWRTITAATSGELTVDPPWQITHTTATEYVVLNTDYWEEVLAVGGDFESVEVVGEFYYILNQSVTATIRRVREFNDGGTWRAGVTYSELENVYANRLTAIREPETGKTALYGYLNDHELGPVYWKMYVPPAWGKLYRDLGEILPTNLPWNSAAITNVTQSIGDYGTKITIAGGFTTGLIASKDLDTPLTIAEGGRVAALMHSTRAITTGQLTLKLSNRTYAQQQKLLADYAFHGKLDRLEVATSVSTVVPATGTPTDKPKIYDGSDDSSDTIALTTTNDLLVIFSKPVNTIQANVAVANTTGSITLTLEYFNGEEFVTHTITSGNFGGATAFGATGKQTIVFVLPGDIAQYTANDVTGYAYRLKVSGSIDGTTALYEVAGKNTEGYEYNAFVLGRDGNGSTDETTVINTNDSIVIGKSERFDRVVVTVGGTVNAAAATLSLFYFNGEKLTSGTIASDGTASGGATLAQTGTITITVPSDWKPQTIEGVSAYFLHFQVNADLTDEAMITELAVYLDEQTYDIDCVLAINTWTWISGAIAPGANQADESMIRNVSLVLNSDLDTQTIQLKDGVQLISELPDYKPMNGFRATNIVAYGTEGLRIEPYLLFEAQRPHRIDTLNGDALVPILVTAFETIADETNGRAAAHSGVYLYFNAGPRLFRYFEGSLESVGPDLDEGLPYNRQGTISALIPYAGDAVIYAVDAATRDPDFEGAVFLRSGSGVHELYRAPRGEAIRDLRLQVIPGLQTDRLWMNVGSHLVWIPMPSYTRDPLKDLDSDGNSNFPYTHDGYVDMGYISDGALGLNKVFVSILVVSRNLSSGQLFCVIYYRLDDATTWTKVSTTITTSPTQEVVFSTTYPVGKRLQVRARLMKDGGQGLLTTPVIEALLIKGVTIYPGSYTYTLSFLLQDYAEDLQGRPATHHASTDMTQLDSWRNAGTVLTYNNPHRPWDARKMIIQSLNYKVAALELAQNVHREEYYVQMQLLDVTV